MSEGFDTSEAWKKLVDQGVVSETVWTNCSAEHVDYVMGGGFVVTNENGRRFLECQINRTRRFIQDKLGVDKAAVCADHLRRGFLEQKVGYSGVKCAWSQAHDGSTVLKWHWIFTSQIVTSQTLIPRRMM